MIDTDKTTEERLAAIERRLGMVKDEPEDYCEFCEFCGNHSCDCDIEANAWRDEDKAKCGCRYCFCMEETECGAVCSSCSSGAHQG